MNRTIKKILCLLLMLALLPGVSACAFFAAPADAVPYSEAALEEWADSIWQSGIEEGSRSFTGEADTLRIAADIEAYTDRLAEENARYWYTVANCAYSIEGYRKHSEVTLRFQYQQRETPYEELLRVQDLQGAVNALYPLIQSGRRSIGFLAEGDWSEEDVKRLAGELFNNAVETAGECYNYSYAILQGVENYVNLQGRYVIDKALLASATEAMQAELDRMAGEIRGMNLGSQREQYTAAAMAVIERAEYDDDAALAAYSDELTDSLKLRRSAYGAVVEGKTVCSGYAMAFKGLCDRLGLPCWIIPGYLVGSGHVWNAVRIGENTLFVDCCAADTDIARYDDDEVNQDYLLMTVDQLRERNYLWSTSQMTPWGGIG